MDFSFSVDAPEFVPSWMPHSSAVTTEDNGNETPKSYASLAGSEKEAPQEDAAQELLCPYYELAGRCDLGTKCVFVHGDVCDMCHKACLNPNSPQQRKEHHRQCVAEHEKAMEEAFAAGNTIDKTCGICMDNVWEKNGRFGILQNCRHCFCLECIRKWRQSQEMESKTIRSCPECRTHSHFVIPTSIWVEQGPEKEKLIEEYQRNMSKKTCKYFKPNDPDSCKFGNKCFYRHENADGTIAECDSPTEISRRSRHRMPFLVDYLLDERAYYSSDDEREAEILSLMLNHHRGDLGF